jgi:Putative DNA-binding domain
MSTLTLRELQAAFQRAVQGEPEEAFLAEIADDGLAAAARVDIYRHHVFTTLTDVLTSTYPVVLASNPAMSTAR